MADMDRGLCCSVESKTAEQTKPQVRSVKRSKGKSPSLRMIGKTFWAEFTQVKFALNVPLLLLDVNCAIETFSGA